MAKETSYLVMLDPKINQQTTIRRKKRNERRYFKKRVFSFKTFVQHLRLMVKTRKEIKNAVTHRYVSKAFSEHIMLASSSVNGCVYCEWGHTRVAAELGVSKREIKDLLSLDFGKLHEEELPALIFTQHYANSRGSPTEKALRELVRFYGKEKSKDILAFIRMITMGNLLGNTISGFESRVEGKPAEEGSLLFELLVFIPVGFMMRLMYKKSLN